MCDSARHAEDCAQRLRDANQAAAHLAGENRELRLALGAATRDLWRERARTAVWVDTPELRFGGAA